MATGVKSDQEVWIDKVLAELIPRLVEDPRFLNSGAMVARFHHNIETWKKNGEIRPIIEDANELAAALALLGCMQETDTLQYEPRLKATKKTFDFLVTEADGKRHWVDVKTIAPTWADTDESWERFERLAQDFPGNARLVVARDMAGAGISGQQIKARWSMIQRTSEIEEKIALLTPEEMGSVRLLLCSDNFAWRKDELEDFADFYHTGQFREDDWSRNAVRHFLDEREISYSQSITGLCYLGRPHQAVFAEVFAPDVRGPVQGRGGHK